MCDSNKIQTCPAIAKNDQSRNILSGMLTKYSWKNADKKNTARFACVLLKPLDNIGLYKCLCVNNKQTCI